jgi:hypothetical protein
VIGELPSVVRVAYYAALLTALGVVDALTEDWYLPLAVLVAFLFLVLPVLVRLFGRRPVAMPKASGRSIIAFAAVLTVLTAIETALIPDYGLGALFWIVATLIPSFEFLGYVARREARSRS